MTTGDKLSALRKGRNLTQDQLADLLDVSRQAVSKWESDTAYPETDKLIRLAELYGVSVDYLLREGSEPRARQEQQTSNLTKWHYEYKSQRTLFGLPLVHINFGIGFYKAKGILAVGNLSCGLLSIGILSVGLLSIGTLALGVLALGAFALALLSIGAIALGFMALGAIAVGIVAVGAIGVGYVSFGALGVGYWFSAGDHAYAQIALGSTHAEGKFVAMLRSTADPAALTAAVHTYVPAFFRPFCEWVIHVML